MKPLSFAKLVIVCATAAVASGCSIVPSALGFDRMEVTAEFENVAGLYVGNEVAVLGLPVGTVEAIEPNGATATVTLSVDRKVRIPADAIAATVSPQLITNRHVELTPAYTGDGPTLAAGDHIPLQRTRTPVELDRILENFDRLGEALKGNNQDGPMASRVLYPLLNGNGDKLRETLDSLSSAFQVTVANKDQIANTLVKLNEIAQIVAANDQTVRDFSGRITELVALMAEQAPGLRDVLAQLNDFIENTSAVVGENREQLTGALTRLTGLTDQIRSNATNLTEIVDLTPLLFQNLDNAVSREHGALRLHALTDKSLLDGEALALFCERIQMRSDGCRTGKIADFGPDLGAPRVDSMTHRHTIGTTAVAVTTTLLLAVTGCGTTVADLPLPEPGIDGETYTVHAIFEDALNLPERAHVKIGGTDVGVVTAIDTVGFAADVEMQISADVELARDTTVELRQGTPLGDMFVAITTPPDRQGGDLLVDGDTITIDNTSAGASVEELLVSVSMLLNGGALNQVARISSELNSMFVGRAPQLSHLFVQLNGIMGSLNERTAQVDATLQGLDALMATMNQRKAELGQAAEEFPPVVGVIAEDNQSISRLIEKVSVTTAALGDFTDTTGPEFLSLFDNVQKLMDGFARMGDNLAGSLNGIHTLYEPVTESFQGNALAVAATVSFLSLGALTDPQGSRLPDGTDIGAFAGSLVDVIGRVIGRLQSPPR